jgi:hypothetical protein
MEIILMAKNENNRPMPKSITAYIIELRQLVTLAGIHQDHLDGGGLPGYPPVEILFASYMVGMHESYGELFLRRDPVPPELDTPHMDIMDIGLVATMGVTWSYAVIEHIAKRYPLDLDKFPRDQIDGYRLHSVLPQGGPIARLIEPNELLALRHALTMIEVPDSVMIADAGRMEKNAAAERRNWFIFTEEKKGTKRINIRRVVNKTKGWEPVDSDNGIKYIAEQHSIKYNLGELEARKRTTAKKVNRPTKRSKLK